MTGGRGDRGLYDGRNAMSKEPGCGCMVDAMYKEQGCGWS